MNTYLEFIDDVVREIADLTATTESKKQVVKHIESFLKLYKEPYLKISKQIFEVDYAVIERKLKKRIGHIKDASLWLYPPQTYGRFEMKEVDPRLIFTSPTEQEKLDSQYTLLAIIHDGQKQGPFALHRIYFDWSTEGVLKDPANSLGRQIWSYYVSAPFDEQFAKTINFAEKEPSYRSVIQDSLNAVRIDLRPLANANEQEKEIEADLAKLKPAETEQNAAPAKGSKIGNFLWKLYEKTLKVVVDAVMERWWPKQ